MNTGDVDGCVKGALSSRHALAECTVSLSCGPAFHHIISPTWKMSDQELDEHLSVKGQMAARYRERQNMAFTMANCTKGDGDDSSAGASVAATVSDVPGALARHGIFRSADQALVTSEPLAGTSRNVATARLPMTTRSKSSLGESHTNASKPTMKDLITKFETRFFTSTQLRQNTQTDGEKHRMARDAWGSSCPRIKMELDPSAMTSSSSSDVVDSKSSATLSKPPHAKISRATLSLNHETNTRLQMLQSLNRPLSRAGFSNTPEQLSVEDLLNVTNSHRFTDDQNMNTVNQPEADDAEEVPVAKEDTSNIPSVASNTESVHDKISKAGKEPNQNADEQEVPAVRVNLRDYAHRRKTLPDQKYIVHTKDWGKRLPKKDTVVSSMDVPAYENASYNIASPIGNDKDLSLKDNKSRSIPNAYKSGANKIKQNVSSPHLHLGNPKVDARCRSRQSERSDESKDLPRDETMCTKAMERYLQFIQSHNPPPLNQAANDGKEEKTDLRKASRPPTPHRTSQLHKGNSSAFRSNAQNVRESSQSTSSTQETSKLPNKTDRDIRLERLLKRRPRSQPSVTNESKEAIIDPSGGDFSVMPAFSSTNSVDSNVHEHNNKLNTSDGIGLPKSETSDIKLTRPVPASSKPTSKWSALPGRNITAKRFSNTTHIRPHSARAHETSDKKQIKQVTSSFRTRSSSASKTQDPVTAKKPSSLFSSPKNFASLVSSTRRNFPIGFRNNDRGQQPPKSNPFDNAPYILTEDEIADNDLVPPHLRERKPRDASGQISSALSSSDDSQNARLGRRQFNKISDVFSEKPVTEIIDRMEPQCLEDEARSVSKGVFSGGEMTYNKNNPLDDKRIEENRHFALQGKRRSTNTSNKCPMPDFPTEDLIRPKISNVQQPRYHNAHATSLANVNKISDLSNSPTLKAAKDTKEGPNLTCTVVQDERKTGYGARDGRERRFLEQLRATPEPFRVNIRGDNLHGASESTVDKTLTYMVGKPLEPAKGSPCKKSLFQSATVHNSSFLRKLVKEKKADVPAEPNTLLEPILRTREPAHRLVENVYPRVQNPFHFGNTQEKDETYAEGDSKTEKLSAASPQKKKRKSDQPRKPAKKKKKTETVSEESAQIRALLSPDSFAAKMPKWKPKDASKKEEEAAEKMDRAEKSDMFDPPTRRRSSGELSTKSHRTCRKPSSRENSVSSAFTDYRLSPRKDLFTPDKCSTKNMSSPASTAHCLLLPVTRLTCQPTDRFPTKSHIPLVILTSTAFRSRLDKLIQYRRWQESMVETKRRSRLPLTESFRKTLDTSVFEEMALHCWQPTGDIFMDTQGMCQSPSSQEVQSGSAPESLLGDGRLLSKEGLLDFTARLPYMKVGPLRFLHATYILLIAACFTLGQLGVQMYQCGGDDYEYYCKDDDLECLAQMLANNR